MIQHLTQKIINMVHSISICIQTWRTWMILKGKEKVSMTSRFHSRNVSNIKIWKSQFGELQASNSTVLSLMSLTSFTEVFGLIKVHGLDSLSITVITRLKLRSNADKMENSTSHAQVKKMLYNFGSNNKLLDWNPYQKRPMSTLSLVKTSTILLHIKKSAKKT
jgi:hypothetical protein